MRLVSSEMPPLVSRRGANVSPSLSCSWMVRHIFAFSSILLLVSAAIASAQGDTFSKSKKPKPTPCATSITKCGCTITSPGFYQVQKAIALPGTLNTADSSCIAISAPRVTLYLAGFAINDAPFTVGIGIHFNPSAKNSLLAGGGSTISGWTTGVEDEASGVTIANVVTQNNTAAGILVQNANGVVINHFGSHANGSYGVQLNDIARSEVSDGVVDAMGTDPLGKNLVAGIALGPSSGVEIFGNCVTGNGGFGIELEANAINAKVTGNELSGNVTDLSDMNNDCGSNLWFGNAFTSGNPATCIGSSVVTTACGP